VRTVETSTLLDSGMDVYFPREVTESEEAAISEETALIAEMRLGMNMAPFGRVSGKPPARDHKPLGWKSGKPIGGRDVVSRRLEHKSING